MFSLSHRNNNCHIVLCPSVFLIHTHRFTCKNEIIHKIIYIPFEFLQFFEIWVVFVNNMIIMNSLLCVSAFIWVVYLDNMIITVNLALFACMCKYINARGVRITFGCHASGAAHLCL